MDVREFRRSDGDALRAFWSECGIRIRPGDDDEALARFGARNEGMFLLVLDGGAVVGSILAGWDGRRGWLYHVAVSPDRRRSGIGRELVARIEARLRELGCPKVNLIVWNDNADAKRFWASLGYHLEDTVEYGKLLE